MHHKIAEKYKVSVVDSKDGRKWCKTEKQDALLWF